MMLPTDVPKNQVIRSVQDALELYAKISPGQTWAYDLETDGLKVRTGNITDIALYNGTTAYDVIHKEWVNGYAELKEVVPKNICQMILSKLQHCRLRTWNGSFDARFTYHYFGANIIENIWEDGMLKAHLADENQFNYKLKETGARIFGSGVLAERNDMAESIKANGGEKKEFYKADSQIRALYACQDVRLTWDLCEYFEHQLKADGLSELYQSEVMELYRHVTIYMELNGIPVDVPYLQQTKSELDKIMEETEEKIQTAIAPLLGPFNKWYVEKEYKFELNTRFKQKLGEFMAPDLWPRTESGTLSFNKADLERAKNLTKTEIKKGLTRPLLQDSEFEKIVSGTIRCPRELITKVQLALMADDGVKTPFNISSKDHWKRVFFGTSTTESLLKEKAISFTPKGSPQFDDDFLETVKHKYDWIPLLQRYNSLSKLNSTYITRILDEQENGVWYPEFKQHGTTSGRYSGDAQQLPRIKDETEVSDEVVRKYTNLIRGFFISGDGYKFVDADYESLEVVVFADDAGDEPLLNIIKNKEDFYSRVAIEVYGLHDYSSDKKAENFLKKHKPAMRQAAKAFALGIRYGEEAYKIHKELNITQKEAEGIVNSYFRQFPQLKLRMDELKRSAKQNGFVSSKAGRLRRLPEIPKIIQKWGDCVLNGLELWKEYHEDGQQYLLAKKDAKIVRNLINNSLNFPIQSYAATIVNAASIAIAKKFKAAGLSAYICLSIHDELCIRCPDHEAETVSSIVRDCMENTTKLSVPLTAEPIVGTRYSEVK